MKFLELLHIAAAIFLIGPLTLNSSVTSRYIRMGGEGVPVLQFLNRTTRVYAVASTLVFVLGIALVRPKHEWGEFWISASMTLFVVALALVLVFVERDQRVAIRRLESGDTASVQGGRIAAISGATALMWLVILALMVYRPGE